jgi:hypothetical protein
VKKQLAVVLSLVIITVIAVSSFAAIEDDLPSSTHVVAAKKPFYVGVTYCGDSVSEAEQLIDSVKNYTNLFVVQSGPLMDDLADLNQICNYAVQAGLNIIVYFTNSSPTVNVPLFISNGQATWGSHFLGVYYCDELGGKMLGAGITINSNNMILNGRNGEVDEFPQNQTQPQFYFSTSGVVSVVYTPQITNQSSVNPSVTPIRITYYPNGTISYTTFTTLIYEPNGKVLNQNGQVVNNQGNISQFEPYQQVLNQNPLLNYTDVANVYVSNLKSTLSDIGNQTDVNLFTSDYGLYWFDYLGGYNTVFAELFGTQTDTQTLALDRGAANMQDKNWGVMIEPACQSPLTLQTGGQIYNELRQAYEDGAGYAVVFNYAPNSNSTVGLLQDNQFAAIQEFWTEIVQNPNITNNVKGQDAIVLPSDYGWGMRSSRDTIWGIWQPDASSQQVWNSVHQSLAKYVSRLDIVYADSAYPTQGRYQRVAYWNQTAQKLFLLIKQWL